MHPYLSHVDIPCNTFGRVRVITGQPGIHGYGEEIINALVPMGVFASLMNFSSTLVTLYMDILIQKDRSPAA